MVVVSASLKIEDLKGLRRRKSLKIIQGIASGTIDVPGVNVRPKSFHKAASKAFVRRTAPLFASDSSKTNAPSP